jgi:hypothetical protein
MTEEDMRERAAKIRKKLRDTVPGVVAAIYHGDGVIGAYTIPGQEERATKVVQDRAGEWDGFDIQVSTIPQFNTRP